MGDAEDGQRRVVALCTAKDCRGEPGHAELAQELTSGAVGCRLVESRCLDVCTGPVVVIGVGEERPVVLHRVRKPKQRRDLLALVAGGQLTDRLRAIRVRGKPRRTAIRRVRPR